MNGRGRLALLVLALLGACARFAPPVPPPGIGPEVPFAALQGWGADDVSRAFAALRTECPVLSDRPAWAPVCQAALANAPADSDSARAFFERWFVPHRVYARDGGSSGLVTAYFEPLVDGRRHYSPRFRYPLYARPNDLLDIDLGALYPALAGERVRGRLIGHRVVPYFTRRDIEEGHALKGQELVWLSDPMTAFLFQVQGSGIVRLRDGTLLALRYADQNGYPYRPLMECFNRLHLTPPAEIDLPGLKAWVRTHPRRGKALLLCNESFVFFRLGNPNVPPRGALGVPLTQGRSVAVDPRYIPLGIPLWLEAAASPPLARLVLAQDTGGAIRGPVRVDLFLGRGPGAEARAGEMKASGQVFALLPRLTPAGPPASRAPNQGLSAANP